MSNGKIERIAVNAIEDETNEEGAYLVANIPTGDKAPSFDGYITVYKDDSERKESYINDVPTQVKGTIVKTFTLGNKKYSLDIIHYQNFYKRGGCLLFVVEILKNKSTKIFYKQLLPIELKEIISLWGHQKSYSVELRPLEETTIYYVCKAFIDQMIKQPRLLIENNLFKDEDYEELIFTSMTYNPLNKGIKDIFNHDFIQFGLKNNIQYPLRNTRINTIAIATKDKVQIKGSTHEVMVKNEYQSNRIIKVIEDCLEFKMEEKNNKIKKIDFRIIEIKSLAAQLKILPLLIDFLQEGEIKFIDFYGEINLDESYIEVLKDLKNTYSMFLKLQEIFIELKVDENTKFGNKETIHQEIEHLVEIFSNKNYSKLNFADPNSPRFVRYTIGDIYLILYYNPIAENRFINAFSEKVLDMPMVLVINETNEEISISPYLLLEKETLINAVNIDIDIIIKSFNSIEYEKCELIFSHINNFCLVCINIFDLTGNKDILKLPLHLLSKLKEMLTNSLNKQITSINLLQTKYRFYEELTQDDYKELVNLKEIASLNTEEFELKFCVSVLFQSKKEAELLFDKLDSETQEAYKDLPIFTLYNNLK